MKIKISIAGLLFIVIVGISFIGLNYFTKESPIKDNSLDLNMKKFEEVTFKLGALYALKAQKDIRLYSCGNGRDFAELAWKIFIEENRREKL
ncbi:MAG: hypothetical protein SWO11_22790, partial [Thermodesulfobacteriota bacterium]|nr:hypothetical protein [Thermodesulfobacteriota bacterium]